jgi:alpha-glucosidase
MLLILGLSGVPFCGADVGGFLDNATGELLARWTQMAAFTPFFRNHSNIGTQPQEPWAYGPVVEVICKKHIELRYQLLPYLYLLFVEAHRSGTPIMRPLLWHYQNDLAAVGVSDQFLLGPGLLIAPIVQPATCARSVYLPAGDWFDFWTGEHHQGGQHVLANADLDRIPVYARGGSIIPMRAVQQYVGEQRLSTINLHLWSGEASDLQWYEDDGMSSGSAQEIHERTIQFTKTRRGFNLRFSQAQGRFRSQIQVWRVIFRGTPRPFSVELQGRELRGRFSAQFGLFTFECPNQAAPFEARLDYS